MFNKKSKEEFNADKKRISEQQDRNQKVYSLQPESWLEEIKQFEQDFISYVSENPEMQNHLEKYWEQMGIIRINSIIPLNFSIKDIVGYKRNQMKWDALQILRCRRKFAINQEQQAFATITEDRIEPEAEIMF